MHDIFYVIHILSLIIILISTIFLLVKKEIPGEQKKKYSLYLMSSAHTQLLTGFILFFLVLSQVNHAKIGVKILFAIGIAILTANHKKKIFSNNIPHKLVLPGILLSAILTTLIAFFF